MNIIHFGRALIQRAKSTPRVAVAATCAGRERRTMVVGVPLFADGQIKMCIGRSCTLVKTDPARRRQIIIRKSARSESGSWQIPHRLGCIRYAGVGQQPVPFLAPSRKTPGALALRRLVVVGRPEAGPFSQVAQTHCAFYEYEPVLSDINPHS